MIVIIQITILIIKMMPNNQLIDFCLIYMSEKLAAEIKKEKSKFSK